MAKDVSDGKTAPGEDPSPSPTPARTRTPVTPLEPAGAESGGRERLAFWESIKRPTRLAILLAIIVGLLAGAGAAAAIWKQPPRYQSVATLTIDQPLAIVQAGSEGVITKLNDLRAKYATLLYTSLFTDPIASELRLSKEEVAGSITVGAPGPSLVLFIASRTKDPTTSKMIAQHLAEHLVTYIKLEQEHASIRPIDRIIFSIVVPAGEGVKVEPTKKRAGAIGAVAAAFVFGATYVFVQFLVARRRR